MKKNIKNTILIKFYTLLFELTLYAIALSVIIPAVTKALTAIAEQPHQVFNWVAFIIICPVFMLVLLQIHNIAQSFVGGFFITKPVIRFSRPRK